MRFRDTKELWIALLVYVGLLIAANAIALRLGPGFWPQVIPTVLPIGGGVLFLVAWMRLFRRMDEMQRRVQLEGLALACGATGLTTFAWGFFEDAGAMVMPTFAVLPMIGTFWAIGVALAERRYR